jgi:hypothetical protein
VGIPRGLMPTARTRILLYNVFVDLQALLLDNYTYTD